MSTTDTLKQEEILKNITNYIDNFFTKKEDKEDALLHYNIFNAIHCSSAYLKEVDSKIFKKIGLTLTQGQVLVTLYINKSLAARDIEKSIYLPVSNINVLIKQLEQQDLILQEPSKEDKRVKILSLTSKAVEKIESVLPNLAEKNFNSFNIYTKEEKLALNALLQKFIKAHS